MTNTGARGNWRFLLVYRREQLGDSPASEVWRGWIAAVDEAAPGAEPQRRWFDDLEQIPNLIRELMNTRPQAATRPTSKGADPT